MTKHVYYTGTLTHPDDPEDSDGEHGWVDLQWSTMTLFDSKDDVRPDTFTAEDAEDETPAQWLARTITQHLGYVEPDSSHGTPRWFSACDAEQDYRTGEAMRLDAHPEGFTPEEITEAFEIMRSR